MISRSSSRPNLVGTSQGKPPPSSLFVDALARTARRNGKVSIVLKPRPGGDKSMVVMLVPLKGGIGRDYITRQKARTISGIYCHLVDYMPPTTF